MERISGHFEGYTDEGDIFLSCGKSAKIDSGCNWATKKIDN